MTHFVPTTPTLADLPSLPPLPQPRMVWAYGYADTLEEAINEAVLWLVFFVTFYQAAAWVIRRLRRRSKAYRPISRQQTSKIRTSAVVTPRDEPYIGGGAELEDMPEKLMGLRFPQG